MMDQALIVDNPDYKLKVSMVPLQVRTSEYFLITFERWQPEQGSKRSEFYLTQDELDKLRQVLNATE